MKSRYIVGFGVLSLLSFLLLSVNIHAQDGVEEEVRERSIDPVALPQGQVLPSALLTLPPERFKGPYPAVVLLAMRGEHDLSCLPTGQPIYRQMAHALAREGIASIRIASVAYENASVAELFTEQRLVDEASAALYYLAQQPQIDTLAIGVLGHALGALTAMHLAQYDSVACRFLVLLNPPGLPLSDILLDRKRAQMEIANVPLSGLTPVSYLYKSMKSFEGNPEENRWIRWLVWRTARVERSLIPDPPKADSMRRVVWKRIKTPAFRSLVAQNPAEVLSGVRQPILSLHALKDSEFLPIENMEVVKSTLKKARRKTLTAVKVKGLNHLFLPATTGYPSEYQSIEASVPSEVLEQISDWILEQCGGE